MDVNFEDVSCGWKRFLKVSVLVHKMQLMLYILICTVLKSTSWALGVSVHHTQGLLLTQRSCEVLATQSERDYRNGYPHFGHSYNQTVSCLFLTPQTIDTNKRISSAQLESCSPQIPHTTLFFRPPREFGLHSFNYAAFLAMLSSREHSFLLLCLRLLACALCAPLICLQL
jgi:hypothetical protein